jgi:fused signal recognition particle receptor
MNWFKRLTGGLNKTASGIKNSIGSIFKGNKLDVTKLESLEDQLISCDIGIDVSEKLVKKLKSENLKSDASQDEILLKLSKSIEEILSPVSKSLEINENHKPHVIVLVGVNGTGKTTTAGKMAAQFKNQGKTVLLSACDTFRAAAIEQLEVWADRAGVEIVSAEKGSDPAALAYKSLVKAIDEKIDVLIVDTAGRLQVKSELMEELKKIIRVLGKNLDGSPHDRVIVLDGATGQNAHSQVTEFSKAVDISGMIVTKLDGSAKGGIVVSLAENFGIPIHSVGVGESLEDLDQFSAEEYSRAIVGLEKD